MIYKLVVILSKDIAY